MATQNAIGLTAAGIAAYDGTGTFTAALAGTYVNLPQSGSNFTIAPMSTAKWIVNPVAGAGTHTTIAAAISAASSGDDIFISPGLYVENLSLKAGVNLTGFGCDNYGNVIIQGNCTFTGTGSVNIYGIQLQTNSDYLISVTGSAASVLNIDSCYLNMTNHTGILYSSSSGSSTLDITNCVGDLGTTGISVFNNSGAGICYFYNSYITNSGSSVTANTFSAGNNLIRNSTITNPITTSSTATLQVVLSTIITGNTTSLMLGGGDVNLLYAFINSGTASAISISSPVNCGVRFCQIISTNTNAITGSGQVLSNYNVFTSSANINTTTRSLFAAQGVVGSSPATGALGEVLSANVPSGSAVSLTTATPANITSLSLTPGTWMVSGLISFVASLTASQIFSGINATSATFTTNVIDYSSQSGFTAQAGTATNLATPIQYITLTTTTTYYLNALANFVAGTCTAYGKMQAVRVG
jgi:hypothetical protein